MSLHDFDRVKKRLKSVADPVGFLVNLFAHAPVGFAVWTAEGNALLTNMAFMDIFGAEPPPEYNVLQDDVIAKNGMLALFERAFKGETVHVPTFWYDPRDLEVITVHEGRRVAISMTIFPLFKASGEIDYVAATYKDETEIMLAHDRLRIGEERQRLAHQGARAGMFEWNIRTGVNVWSPELEAMYGLLPGAFETRHPWESLLHPDDRARALQRVNEALTSVSPVSGEWRVVWPDGSVHWVEGRFQAFRDESGEVERLIGVNVDITARKSAEEEIRRLNDDLERRVEARTRELRVANRELEAFSYSVAHDLRAPLRAMGSFAQLLLDDHRDKLDPEGLEYLERIHGNAVTMAELIDALLSLARVSRTELAPSRTNLSTLAQSIATALATTCREREVEVVIEDNLFADIDPTLARMLLENLLGNAWKFTTGTARARIEMGAAEIDGATTYFVRDNGAGFDMAYVAKLFLPFQRLHAARDFPGTGIGLATTHRIVDRHRGRIWAQAAVGEGARFFFTLPGMTKSVT